MPTLTLGRNNKKKPVEKTAKGMGVLFEEGDYLKFFFRQREAINRGAAIIRGNRVNKYKIIDSKKLIQKLRQWCHLKKLFCQFVLTVFYR